MKLFVAMKMAPWPFIIILPAVMVALAVVGWNQSDIIESNVVNIWTRSSGSYSKDKAYADSVGKGNSATSTFVAMSIARDDNTLLQADRLEEIRTRMEATENTTVEYNGITYTWEDVCASNNAGPGTTYKFPCARLTPMDLYQEARWFFNEVDRVTWYDDIIRKILVKPRVPRFGVMQNSCSSVGATSVSNACDHILALRQSPVYAVQNGFPADYANPLSLFADIGGMEMNNPCAICIEEQFEGTMAFLTTTITGMFGAMFQELSRYRRDGGLTNAADLAKLDGLIQNIGYLASTMSREKIEDFYSYYVIRTLYSQLGATSYASGYANFMGAAGQACIAANGGNAAACPATVNTTVAMQHLLNHADHAFSSMSTAGVAFPFWDAAGGAMFNGTEPVGGSGIDMSGTFLSATAYMDLGSITDPSNWKPLYSDGQFMNPLGTDPFWNALVETDPVYRWFMAEVTPMTSSCGNGFLTGTKTGIAQIDTPTGQVAAGLLTQRWCTKFNTPFGADGQRTQQHFARMWYDLLLDSPSFLSLTKGESDPYVWTTGQGCDYNLLGQRYSYTGQTNQDIASNSSRLLYFVDEGVSAGAIDRNLLMGGITPPIGEFDFENPIQKMTVMQTLYILHDTTRIVDRVRNCNRPGEGPVDITEKDAEEILVRFKEAMEKTWYQGWDDENAGQVQFVGFTDDQGGVIGTTGRILEEITLDNGLLMAMSIVVIVLFSAIFLFSPNLVESRVVLTLFGVGLVLASFFGALGLGILIGIKVNVNIAWTLPFIILGLGVDDMYIVMLSIKKQKDYSAESFLKGMKEVVIPVTMTSLVNASMFAIMNIVDIPAVYKTAQMALIAVIFLYISIIFAFPAYCYLDMQRQQAGRYDMVFCVKKDPEQIEEDLRKKEENNGEGALYTHFYKPVLLGKGPVRYLSNAVVLLGGLALFIVGIYGITQRRVGLGLEDFFPASKPAKTWAEVRTAELASWSFAMNWGAESYGEPDTQMGMMAQFEGVVGSKYIAESDTQSLWIADFNVWTTRQCYSNFDRDDPLVMECGRDQVYPVDNSTCSGFWTYNKLGLREKNFGDGITCVPNDGGVCRPTSQMHRDDLIDLGINPIAPANTTASWCPVFSGWSDDKLAFCLRRWSNFTGGGGNFILEPDSKSENPTCAGEFRSDGVVTTPIAFSAGPTLFAFDLNTHEDTIDMIEETRGYCDDNENIRCWLVGIPFDYWEQYLWVEEVLVQLSGASIGLGFAVAWIFLFSKLMYEGNHGFAQNLGGSFVGALLIAIATIFSLIPVIGLSVLVDVNLTAFSDMSFVLSVGFAVEYAVHVVHRFLEAPSSIDNALDRVDYAMSFLTLPTFMSFFSSLIGVICLAFTEFEFNEVFFFRPLIIVMFVTYFMGCWFLPVLLTMLDFEALRLGAPTSDEGAGVAKEGMDDQEEPIEQPMTKEPLQDNSQDSAMG